MSIPRPASRQPLPPHARKVFTGEVFDVYQWPQKLYDGREVTFEKLKRPDTAVVFPVLPDGRILLTWQEQPGKPPFMGACGGRVEEGEDVLLAAQREMREETGYVADEFVLWDAQQPYSKIEWAVYVFIAYGARLAGPAQLDGGEKITLKPVTFDEFLEMSSNPNFAEKEIQHFLYEARLDEEKKQALKKLFRCAG